MVAGTGRRAGRRAGGAWREPPRRSSRALGAGRGRTPSLNQFKTRGSNGFNCRALFPARGAEAGPAGGRTGDAGTRGPAGRSLGLRLVLVEKLRPSRAPAEPTRLCRSRAPYPVLLWLCPFVGSRTPPPPPPPRWPSRRAHRLRNLGGGDISYFRFLTQNALFISFQCL